MQSRRPIRTLIAAWLVTTFSWMVPPAAAEEFTLQDGQKITGTVVGFENGMFKVETEFGFALVRKDRVKSISFTSGASDAEGRKASTAAIGPASAAPATQPAASPAPAVTAAKPAPAPPPVSRPLDQPLPTEIRERLEGMTYINETFHFSFFKPPGWKVHENTARETGRAIVAISPEDEHTLLFVDRQVWSGPPNLKSDATEANLRRTYQNYRTTSEAPTQLDGRAAIRREFEGELDGAVWRGVAVRIAEGNTVFGLIGLTSAETLEFHQAVLNKIINSFRFLSPGSATSANR
jgi:hypothetical protein